MSEQALQVGDRVGVTGGGRMSEQALQVGDRYTDAEGISYEIVDVVVTPDGQRAVIARQVKNE